MRRIVPIAAIGATFALATAAIGVTSAGATGAREAGVAAPARTAGQLFPKIISLPNGFAPEGIALGRGGSFFVGSTANGAIYRGSIVTGKGAVLVPGTTGLNAAGLEVDGNRVFAAGAGSGTGRVYDERSGRLLAAYQFLPAGGGFINDVVVTRTAAYFTDSVNPVLYVVPFGRGGRLPGASAVRTLRLTGDLVFQDGFNTNGIETTPDGRNLLVVQSNTGKLFSVAPRTGVTTEVDLGGASLVNGDGIFRSGRILYTVQNQNNRVAVVRLDRRGTSGELLRTVTDPALDVPTTVGRTGSFLYAVNARFGTPATPTTTYTVVRLPAR
jgi:hypothetical protein